MYCYSVVLHFEAISTCSWGAGWVCTGAVERAAHSGVIPPQVPRAVRLPPLRSAVPGRGGQLQPLGGGRGGAPALGGEGEEAPAEPRARRVAVRDGVYHRRRNGPRTGRGSVERVRDTSRTGALGQAFSHLGSVSQSRIIEFCLVNVPSKTQNSSFYCNPMFQT